MPTNKMFDDELATQIRTGVVSPEEALQLLKDDRVLVYGRSEEEPTDWGALEDRGVSSGVQHALGTVKASPEIMTAVGEEVVRLRKAGLTMESLWE